MLRSIVLFPFDNFVVGLPSEICFVTSFVFRLLSKRSTHPLGTTIRVPTNHIASDDAERVAWAVFTAGKAVNSISNVFQRE